MKYFLIAMFFFTPTISEADRVTVRTVLTDRTTVRAYISYFKRDVKVSYRNRAVALTDKIVSISRKNGVDPFLTALMMRYESSYQPGVIGKLGERGLMQVHPILLGSREMETIDDEIRIGVEHLSKSLDACPSLKQSINHYMSGRCFPIYRKPEMRFNNYVNAVKIFRGEDVDF